jgi:hypothetical protein
MQKIILSLVLLFSIITFAQNGSINGIILDQKNNQPIPFATIAIKIGDKIQNGGLSNEKGEFSINKLPLASLLKISFQFVGYTTVNKEITLTQDNINFNFGTILLQEDVTQLKEVVIEKRKKAVEQKADRTIFDFSQQAHLNSGSTLEGLKKLPGLIISEVAGMMYQGKQLEVFLDSRPLNISSNELNSFLEGMPANSIEKVEIITQPGAEFPATSGGAIINIITNKSINKYLSATISTNYNFTNYDKVRHRNNSSILISAKNKYFGWQFNLGNNYRESNLLSDFTRQENNNKIILTENNSDRINRGYFAKSALTFDFKKDRLIVNYDLNSFNNNTYTLANGFGFNSNDATISKTYRHDAAANYQMRFDDVDKKLDFRANFTRNTNQFNLNSRIFNQELLNNNSIQDFYNFIIDYTQKLKILDEGKISTGVLYETLLFDTKSFGKTNLDYQRTTSAGYLEFQSKLKQFDFILGTRLEDYNITGKTDTNNLIPFKQFRFFPNATVQYNFSEQIFFNVNYNKKINLPSTSSLNPNNNTYQNPNFVNIGNPELQPTIFDNFEVKISAFDYAYISYSISNANNQVVQRVLETNNQVLSTSLNLNQVTVHNFSFGLPVPYMLFTKGLKETMKFDFNPDKINFMYLYTGYQKHQMPDIDTKGFWSFNIMSQIVLPKEIKFVTEYSYNTTGGNYYYFIMDQPFNHTLDFTFSKKFFNDRLSASVFIDDAFNLNNQAFTSAGTTVSLTNKFDTRRIGFSLNYKLPTKNKLAKEDPNLLNKDKKEEENKISN